MRVIKNLVVKNDKTALVSKIFDKCIRELNYQFFDQIELHLKNEDKTRLEFPKASIYLNYNNPFIQGSDKKAIKIILLKKMISLVIAYRYPNKKIPDFIMEIMSNREVIRKGYSKDLFYYYYLILMQYKPHKVSELNTFMKINIPWLSYFGLDDYDTKFLKDLIYTFNYRKEFEPRTRNLFLAVKKDLLKEKILDKAITTFISMKDSKRGS